MDEEPNRKEFEDAIKDAKLPQFPDFDDVYQSLQAKSKVSVQHTWRQRGPFLVCTSCPHEHSQWIGADKHLTGFDEKGAPIVK